MTPRGGTPGNRNAAKANPASAHLHIRVTPAELAAWRQAAHDAGETVTAMVRRRMNGGEAWVGRRGVEDARD